MKTIFSKMVLVSLAVLLAAVMVAASMAMASGNGLFASDEPTVLKAGESDKPEEYDRRSITGDHPIVPNGGASDGSDGSDSSNVPGYGSITDDEPVKPNGDGVE